MDPAGLNYNSRADFQPTNTMHKCYFPTYGCMDPLATNAGCANNSATPCMLPPGDGGYYVATVHQPSMCSYQITDIDDIAADQQLYAQVSTVVAGDASSNLGVAKNIEKAFNDNYGGGFFLQLQDVATGTVYTDADFTRRRRLQAASGTNTVFRKPVSSVGDANSALQSLTDAGLSQDALQTALGSSGVTVLSAGVASAVIAEARPDDDSWSTGAIIALVIGIIAALALLGAAFVLKKKKMSAKTVVPA